MNKYSTQLKNLTVTFIVYLALTIGLSVLLNVAWQLTIDMSNMTPELFEAAVAQSNFIEIGSALIGVFSAVFCGAFIVKRSGYQSVKPALFFAVLLMFYGLLSALLHPEQVMIQKVSSLIMPFPLALLGAKLAMMLNKDAKLKAEPTASVS
ncbi:MAG: hypothetical protein HWE10_09405 [Gammaproteobacteria bacterium]|nr:hypothetical protein [Gammaproteobacteria bacterium]